MQSARYILENADLVCHLLIGRGVTLEALRDRVTDHMLAATAPLLELARGEVQAQVVSATVADQKARVNLTWPDETGQAEVVVRLDGPALTWQVRLIGLNTPLRLRLPFLQGLLGAGHQPQIDARTYHDQDGRLLVRHADWPLPVVWDAGDGRSLTLLSGTAPNQQRFAQEALFSVDGLVIDPVECTEFTGELRLHGGGWPVTFAQFRQRIRAEFDLAQYQRPDLAWYNDQLVQHFTFLYGREILNLTHGTFELERFLDEGERDFGGYDGMLIWVVYPRIGIDERTQWDFYDDVPGGRAALRAMARLARERGTRFFVPYKPWDQSAELHGNPQPTDHEELARLAADTEADGIFLDTMSAIADEFRAALDRARPGVVFCSEGRAFGSAFETITGSWDQSLYQNINQGNWSPAPEHMPEIDLWRFVFPEHRLFVINRHAMGDDRMRIIQRGFFNGMGWVVWQDVFGLALPFTPAEAALLKRCRTILREHLTAINSPQPTPLLATGASSVYTNTFPAEHKQLWTLYNAADTPVHGALLQIEPRAGYHFVDVWNDLPLDLDGDVGLRLTLAPRSVGAVVAFPQLLRYQPEHNAVMLNEALPDATIEVRSAGTRWEKPATTRTLHLSQTGESCVVRLLRGGELIDQLVVSNGDTP